MIRKSFNLVLIITLAIAATLAQQTPPGSSTPSIERLRQHVTYLASDALEGRRTGTPGANGAAQYIAGEFSRLGLRPGNQAARAARTRGEAQSRFLQRFPYVAGVELAKGNLLAFSLVEGATKTDHTAPVSLQVGDDWMPLGLSANGRVENLPATLVGYGITASELKHDDYASANVAGQIAIAFSGTPDGDNPHGRFARYEDMRWRAIAARNAGARALVVIASEETFKDDRLSRLRYDNSGGDAGLPIVAISRQAAARVLSGSGVSLADLEQWKGTTPRLTSAHNLFFTIEVDMVRREAPAANVIGILEGSDPTLKSEAIVIGAHYDHLGRGGAGSRAQREGEIHHGADDNASGVAGVLELARVFTSERPRPRRTIVFIAFSGEEEGLLGSNYYVNHPAVPLTKTVAMLNMDMIGRMKNKNLIVGGVGTAPEWRRMIESANLLQSMTVAATGGSSQNGSSPVSKIPLVVSANGRTVVSSDPAKQFQLTLNEDGYGPSDHSSFYAKQIPVLFFWTGTHEDYHKPTDTADKINYDEEARILAILARIVNEIDANDKRPAYTLTKSASAGRSTGFRVYLGTIPNYADSNNGLLLDGVREDSPAANAGLKAGDRIVRLAGRDVRNVYDYTYALGEMKAGQEYEVEIVRGAEHLKLKLTPAARK